jgi:D-aminopeptidase
VVTAPTACWYLSVDLEGIGGVTSVEQVFPKAGSSLVPYHQALERLADEVSTVCALIQHQTEQQGGTARFLINDAHAHMTNLVQAGLLKPGALPKSAQVLSGKPKLFGMMAGLKEWQQQLDEERLRVNGVALLGYHAMAGAPKAVLCHSFTESVQAIRLRINETSMVLGEAGLSWLFAEQSAGVPVVFASGDTALHRELQALDASFKDHRFVETKQSLGWSSAICKSQDAVRDAYNAVLNPDLLQALLQGQSWQVNRPSWLDNAMPWHLTMQFSNPIEADTVLLMPNSQRGQDSCSVEWVLAAGGAVHERVAQLYQTVQCAYSLTSYCASMK